MAREVSAEDGVHESTKHGSTEEEADLSRDVYALLAQANLLRMRGHWEEAAERCMAALRLSPDSSSANSLLGDIYENQGRYEDAAQWYRMALDVNPDSPADRVKLDRLRRHGSAQREQPVLLSPTLPASRISFLRLLREPETALRVGAIAAALGLMLVVAFACGAARRGGALRALGIGGDAVVSSKPVVVPPLAGTLPTDPDAAPAHDPSEQSLLAALQAAPDLSRQGIIVYDVQADPRAGRMIITFGLPPSAGLTQAGVAHAALRVLQAAPAGQSVAAFTARGLLLPSGGSSGAALAFVGDVSRAAVQASASAGAGLTDAQAQAAFSNVWWSLTADVRA